METHSGILFAIIFLIVHWYGSLFTQSFFNHRYSAHGMFTMSKTMEKIFFILSWILQGSSYLSPWAYGILHRKHHADPDGPADPHSPKHYPNVLEMMWETKKAYTTIREKGPKNEENLKFSKNVPKWHLFDAFACSWFSILFWVAVYILLYWYFAVPFWLYPLLLIHFVMGPVHGAIINWFAHKVGYRNYEVADTSSNIVSIDLLMWGEALHNNHHYKGSNPNFAHTEWEFDPMYPIILLFNKLRIISLKKS